MMGAVLSFQAYSRSSDGKLSNGAKLAAIYLMFTMNATMYREAGARRCAHFNPELPRSVLERGLIQLSFPSSKNWVSVRTRLSPHKCMVENWWSLTIEVATDDKHCVELLKHVQQKFEQ